MLTIIDPKERRQNQRIIKTNLIRPHFYEHSLCPVAVVFVSSRDHPTARRVSAKALFCRFSVTQPSRQTANIRSWIRSVYHNPLYAVIFRPLDQIWLYVQLFP